jgi:hypothetical protein
MVISENTKVDFGYSDENQNLLTITKLGDSETSLPSETSVQAGSE